MALDMLVDSTVLNAGLRSIADSIRTMTGKSGTLSFPDGLKNAILTIQSGSSNFTLLHSETISVNTTDTSDVAVKTIPIDGIFDYDGNLRIFVRITDTAGMRSGYFYRHEDWFCNYKRALMTGAREEGVGEAGRIGTMMVGDVPTIRSGSYERYGVYALSIDNINGGNVNIYARYNSTRSGTINGTYLVEVYAVDMP